MDETLVKRKKYKKKCMNASRSTGTHNSIKSIERGCWTRRDFTFSRLFMDNDRRQEEKKEVIRLIELSKPQRPAVDTRLVVRF